MVIINKFNENGGGPHTPNKLIIHSMSEHIDGLHASDFLESLGLSAHFLIDHEGTVFKTKRTNLKAWHAKGHNTNSIGIELLVKGSWNYAGFLERIKQDYCTPEQMQALIELSNDIIEYWSIDHDSIVRHSDIDPGRKQDPGSGFDWSFYKSKLSNNGVD